MAAQQFQLDPLLLKSIAWKESRGWSGAIGAPLRAGHRAIGLMQINTIHLVELRSSGIEPGHLFDPCISVYLGAKILADCVQRYGETWRAVGCYYAGPASTAFKKQEDYVRDVEQIYVAYRKPNPQ
jgi:soluble lytic murein transglycosylase-like protein